MKKLAFLFVAICLAFSSCKTRERIEYRDRYIDHYITQEKHDTLREYIKDSVSHGVIQKGDTIYKTKYKEVEPVDEDEITDAEALQIITGQ